MKSLNIPTGADAVLISSVPNIIYLTGYSNFAQEEREAYLIITKNNKYVLTDARYSEAIKKTVSNFELIEISNNYSLKNILSDLQLKHNIQTLSVEDTNLTLYEYNIIKPIIKNIKALSSKHRLIKNPLEVSKIEKASKIGDRAFEYIQKKIKKGVSEKEIAFELESFFIRNGAAKSFDPIVAFGENASIPHHHTGDKKLDDKQGQFILLDFGVKFENYCSDMTRTIFFGKPNNKQIKIYSTVLQSQKKAIDYISKTKNPSGKEADKIARDCITSSGFSTIPHSLGHGIGIEVHESPRLSPKSKDILKEGMVFSIEPGIYIPDFGGVRIEDLFTIENGKLRQLTNSSKDLIIL